jgi:TRAP transporter 4TM/12TM fusion protein
MSRSDARIDQRVAEADQGGRSPTGVFALVVPGLCLAWAVFQLWVASPVPYWIRTGLFNDSEVRFIHLSFALALVFLCYPISRSAPRDRVPWYDLIFALVAASASAYLFVWYTDLAMRPGSPLAIDLAISVVGVVMLLEATRRGLGLPMVILALVFLAYVFLGPYMPNLIAHKGAGLSKAASHFWLTTEGVFGVALGVSASFIFLFVLFGALLEKAGAGNYFILSAVSLLGHLRGGPAKAAVVASASTGMISGSSIANVVTTGTFTIPLMKRVGYPGHKAAAIETAASVNGQIMPPVMGAAAFLMVEYVGIPYTQVLQHALLPALVSYLALLYIVHLEAMKHGIAGIPQGEVVPARQRVIGWGLTLSGLVIVAALSYWFLLATKLVLGPAASWVIPALVFVVYLLLLRYSARQPQEHRLDVEAITKTPPIGPTLRSGLHFLLPVVVLVWCLMVEKLSPGLSAFYATVVLMVMLVTQKPLSRLLIGQNADGAMWWQGFLDLRDGMITGSRNMIGIALATAAAGIIVGTVTLTGIGLVLIEVVEILSGGSLVLMLFLVALICLILGLGLPTTANYIVVSTLMAPVVVEVGAQNGLLVPLIAVHLFVFYFGLMADVTPPVGLATYAAAGIARVNPIKAGITAFGYNIRTAVLPFMFIFNTQLLLIDIDGPFTFVVTLVSASLASMVFAAATQQFFLRSNRLWESAALLLAAFLLFRPDFLVNRAVPPFERLPASELFAFIEQAPVNASVRVQMEGMSLEGRDISKGVLLPLGAPGVNNSPVERLASSGMRVSRLGEDLTITSVGLGSVAARLGVEQGYAITGFERPQAQPHKFWGLIPGLALVLLVAAMQRRRPQAGL